MTVSVALRGHTMITLMVAGTAIATAAVTVMVTATVTAMVTCIKVYTYST